MVSEISSWISEPYLYGQIVGVQDVVTGKGYIWLIEPVSK